MEQYSALTTKHLMFPDGERKPGSNWTPAWRTAEDDVGAARRGDDAETAATRIAIVVEMRSNGFMEPPCW
jgi:hypothetical protein